MVLGRLLLSRPDGLLCVVRQRKSVAGFMIPQGPGGVRFDVSKPGFVNNNGVWC